MVRALAWVLLLPALLGAVPVIDRPVTDPGGVLTAAQTETVAHELVALREATGAQMAVLLVDTTEGEPIEDYTMRGAEAWRGGRRGEDKGLLFVLAVDDRRMRLDVGYGLEAHLPDGVVKGLLDSLRPSLRERDTTGALLQLIQGVRTRLPSLEREPGRRLTSFGPAPVPAPAPRPLKSEREATHEALVVLVPVVLAGFVLLCWLRRPESRQWLAPQVQVAGQLAVAAGVFGAGAWALSGESVATGAVLAYGGVLGVLFLVARALTLSPRSAGAGALFIVVLLGVSGVLVLADLSRLDFALLFRLSDALFLIIPLLLLTRAGPGRWLLAGIIWFIAGAKESQRWNEETKAALSGFFTLSSGTSWGSSGSSDSSWSASSSSDSSWSSSSDSSSSSSDSSSGWSGDGGGFGGGGASSDW